MSEETQNVQNENVQNVTKFLDYTGLSKFWELAKGKSAGAIKTEINEITGLDIELLPVDSNDGSTAISTANIPIASSTSAGLMSKEQAKTLSNIATDITTMVELNGIAFGTGENTKIATPGTIKIETDGDTETYNKYLNLDFKVDSTSKELQIKDLISNTVLSSVKLSDIFTDGFISDADIIEKTVSLPEGGTRKDTFLRLVFNYTNGEKGTVEINVNDLFTEYAAGSGLEIITEAGSGLDDTKHTGTFKVKIKSGEQFLAVDGNGLSTKGIETAIQTNINTSLSNYYNKSEVEEIASNAAADAKTSEEIVIAGGPLATDAIKNVFTNGTISEGTSLQEILEKLFLKEIDGNITKTISWNPIMSNPTVSLSSSGTVEVGTQITGSVTLNNNVTNPKRSCLFTGSGNTNFGCFKMTNNPLLWSTDNPNVPDTTNSSATWSTWSQNINIEAAEGSESGTANISSITWNTTQFIVSNSNTFKNNNTKLSVVEGLNTLTAKQSGVTVTAKALADTIVCASTNTKKRIASKYATLKGDTAPTAKALTSTANSSITGSRRLWYGGLVLNDMINFQNIVDNSTKQEDIPNNVRAALDELAVTKNVLTTAIKGGDKNVTEPTTVIIDAGDSQVVIITQRKIKDITSKAQMGSSIVDNFKKPSTEAGYENYSGYYNLKISSANNYDSVDYHIYAYKPAIAWSGEDILTITYEN